MNDLITIIIPAYNAADYLERCVQTLLNQTHKHLEIIVVNDGSTDGTGKLLDELAQKDPRIKVIHQENRGVSESRNIGLDLATGDYIGFSDADDEAAPDMYELLYTNLINNNADISHCGFQLNKLDDAVKFHGTGALLLQTGSEGVKELLSGKRVEPSVCTKLYKKSLLHNARFPADIKINEDMLFNVAAFKRAKKIVFEDVVKYYYRYNEASASHSTPLLKQTQDIAEAARRVRNLLHFSDLTAEADKFYVSKILNNMKSLHREKLFYTEQAKSYRKVLRQFSTDKMGLRIRTLKFLLLCTPFLYGVFIFIYNNAFSKNQKWK